MPFLLASNSKRVKRKDVFNLDYCVIKQINNNVVLVKGPETDEQLILIAKGIGFSRKPGDIVSDDSKNRKVIKFLNRTDMLNGRMYGKNEIKDVVRSIAESAQKKLLISSSNFYPALLDHICFAIDRVQFGVPIENPFINEISIFYPDEYKEAQSAVKTIREKLGINLGNDEAGFIALHFHSAKKHTPVSDSLQNVRILNKIADVTFKGDKKIMSENFEAVRAFLLTASSIINSSNTEHPLRMPCECRIAEALPQSRAAANRIEEVIKKETGKSLSQGGMDFLTVGIEQLRQQVQKPASDRKNKAVNL